jgi:hypothetical protein
METVKLVKGRHGGLICFVREWHGSPQEPCLIPARLAPGCNPGDYFTIIHAERRVGGGWIVTDGRPAFRDEVPNRVARHLCRVCGDPVVPNPAGTKACRRHAIEKIEERIKTGRASHAEKAWLEEVKHG